jgi:hypothetical protein
MKINDFFKYLDRFENLYFIKNEIILNNLNNLDKIETYFYNLYETYQNNNYLYIKLLLYIDDFKKFIDTIYYYSIYSNENISELLKLFSEYFNDSDIILEIYRYIFIMNYLEIINLIADTFKPTDFILGNLILTENLSNENIRLLLPLITDFNNYIFNYILLQNVIDDSIILYIFRNFDVCILHDAIKGILYSTPQIKGRLSLALSLISDSYYDICFEEMNSYLLYSGKNENEKMNALNLDYIKVRNILFKKCKRMKTKYKRLYQYVSKKKNEIYWSKKIVNEVLDIFRISKDVIKYHIEPFIYTIYTIYIMDLKI